MSLDRRSVSTCLLTSFGILGPSVVWAAEGDKIPAWVSNVGLWLGIPTGLAAAIAAAISFIAPKIGETYNTRWKARLKFVEGVTTNVVELAGTHYWALANAAGTVSDLLDGHLQSLQSYLLLGYARQGRTGIEP